MELIRGNLNRGLQDLKSCRNPSVLTIGNFDGVHLGHQAILRQVKLIAEARRLSAQLMIFEPQPTEYFNRTEATSDKLPPVRLMSWREKYEVIKGFCLDRVVLISFEQSLSELTPEAFLNDVLLNALQMQHLVIGDDFCFGAARRGNFEFLQSQALVKNFEIERAATFSQSFQEKYNSLSMQNISDNGSKQASETDLRVSSTRVRLALQQGALDSAESLLGRPYSLSGRVIYGRQLGRTWGIPTANISLGLKYPALSGVFAVSVSGVNGVQQNWPAVANLGRRPTVSGTNIALEVHIFNLNANLYGQRLRVTFHKKIRDEQKFASVEILVAAIKKDHAAARLFWDTK